MLRKAWRSFSTRVGLELPPGRAIWLSGTQGEDSLWFYLVHVPGRWPCARSAVLGSESSLDDRRLPSSLLESVSDPLETTGVYDSLGWTLNYDIEVICCNCYY